jgi:uncharacterized protein YeaO (DUF488 family)
MATVTSDRQRGNTTIRAKRVYEPVDKTDGERFLVERLWPRGMKKEQVRMKGWLKEVAPSDALRRWFSHDPAKWGEFQRRYRAELNQKPGACRPLLEAAQTGNVTLLFSSRDLDHNNAVALQFYLEQRRDAIS